MKLLFVLLPSFIFTLAAHAQDPTIEWQRTIGGNTSDVLNMLQQTADGGYILGGSSRSTISGNKAENSLGELDYWVVKLNTSGDIEWQNDIGGTLEDLLYSIQQTTDGGYILGGFSNSSASGDKSEGNLGRYDYWVVKLDNLGNIQWQNTIGGIDDDKLYSVQQTFDGGYILGGFSYSGISGDKTENPLGSNDYWIVKLDASGNIQWQNTIGGNDTDELRCVQQTADGGYILGGFSASASSGDKTEDSDWNDYWLVKTDASGNIQWQNTIGGNSHDELFTLQQTSDKGYILGGNSLSNSSGNKTENNWNITMNSWDIWIVKTDSIGNVQWDNTIGGIQHDYLYSIHQTSDGEYIFGGASESYISDDKTEIGNGGFDCWILKTDAAGNIRWQNTIGGSEMDIAYSIQQTPDGGYIVGASSWSNISGDKTENSFNYQDYWVVKLSSCAPLNNLDLQATNPVCNRSNGSASISVLSASGNLSYQWAPVSGTDSLLTGLSPGVYSLTVSDGSCSIADSITITQACGIVSGNIFNDINGNCAFDSGDIYQRNVKVQLQSGGVLKQQTFTDTTGFYSFTVSDYDTFEVSADTSTIPFTVLCPATNLHSSIITALDSIDAGNNFTLTCKQGFDIGIQSMVPTIFRPGIFTAVNISVGDIADFSGVRCVNGVSGSVTVYVNGPATYYAPASGALTPDDTLGNSIKWNVADFGVVNMQSDFNIVLQTNTNAPLGSQICLTVSVLPTIGDNNPDNNILPRHCFTVVNSADPNDKQVSPIGKIDTAQQWLTYTIRFQNTGTAEAIDIYVDDTLDANLDESSFQLVAYSHEPFVQIIENAVRFNFPNINLPDSNANEPASHGYVQYKVKLHESLPIGTQIQNTAFIYFDFNPPVVTNTVTNTISDSACNGTLTIIPNILVPLSCKGASNAALQFDVTDRAGPFSYQWSNGINGASATNLALGNYTVSVLNGDGCYGTASQIITAQYRCIDRSRRIVFPQILIPGQD